MNNTERVKSDYSGTNQASWDSLKKLKALCKDLHTLNVNYGTQHLKTSMPTLIDEKNNDGCHKRQNEILENNNCKNMPAEEMKMQLDILKQSYQKRLHDIETVYKELIDKDKKINELTAMIINHLHKEETAHSENCDQTSQKLKDISDMKMEITNLKRKHNKKLQDIQKENQEKIQTSLAQIKEEYNIRMKEFSEDHDKKIKQLQENICTLRQKLECYDENKEKYITKEQHIKLLNKLLKEHNNELAPYEKEIEKMEAFLKGNCSHFFNQEDLQRELQNGNESNDIVCLISQLDTPQYTSINGIPASIHSKKSTSGMICNSYPNKEPNINRFDQNHNYNLIEEESAGSISEDVKINVINHFQNRYAPFSENI